GRAQPAEQAMTEVNVSKAHIPTKGRCMRRVSLSWLLTALLAVGAMVAVGCGSSNSSTGSSGGKAAKANVAPNGAQIGSGKQGGAVTFLAAADVDYIDPGQTYYTFGYMVQYAVNRTLYSFK